ILKQAKREYRKEYTREYKKERRKTYPEVTVSLSLTQHEYLTKKAQDHHITLASFLRETALAYTKSIFVVPNQEQVAQVSQKLLLIQTDVHMIAKYLKTLNLHDLAQAYTTLEDRFFHLEQYISQRLKEPRSLDHLIKEALKTSPEYTTIIRNLLATYDHQNQQ
ncbi:MAG: hypothetical protein AAFV78_11150, partial [Bacteroidota bacterium]